MTDKMYTKHINHKMLKGLMMLALVLFAAAMIFATSASDTYAADDTSIREAHNIDVNGKRYCFFITNNVVLTPKDLSTWKEDIQKKVEKERKEEIEKKVEEEHPEFTPEKVEEEVNKIINEIVDKEFKEKLANEILTRSCLYMKQTNCKIATHNKIDLKTWNEKICKLALIEEQLNDYIDYHQMFL